MPVTPGSYVDETAILVALPSAAAGFTADTLPSDAQVSRMIEDVEARWNSQAAACGFTLPLVVVATTAAFRAIRGALGKVVAGLTLRKGAARTGPSADSIEALATVLIAEGWAVALALIDAPETLTSAGVTSAYTSTGLRTDGTYQIVASLPLALPDPEVLVPADNPGPHVGVDRLVATVTEP